MTTATAGNLAGQTTDKDKEKEKLEKRRALGRGLASLLPGPRAVPASAPAGGPVDGAYAGRAAGVAGPHAAAAPMPAHREPVVPAGAGVEGGGMGAPPAARASAQGFAAVPAHAPAAGNDSTIASDLPEGMVWPEETMPAATGTPAYDSAAADGTFTISGAAETRVPGNRVVNLAIAAIDKNPFQTRYVDDDDALEELADSIKANGVVQPIMVRPSEDEAGRYVLILGERRLHASKKAGKTHVPAIVRNVSRQQAAEMTIIENLQREDLSPLEQAESFRVLSNEFALTQQQIGERVGLSRESVANYMRLLKLPREVMQMLAEKRINFAKAKELLKLGDNDRIAQAALYAVQKGMNIEQIEMLVLRMDGLLDPLPDMPGVKKREKSAGARWVDPNVRAAQMELERTLGLRVRIRDRKGKGKIVIEYATVDDYDRVVEMLRGKGK
ncbi:MAG TPA: ParB/RepB/Spo0J family partition protein [Candidatus Sulfotelmatobacter sp.]|nr:ParB/RepB/Spo0J family partition protein [Candidatus Sulfotelmatobacter sp.]